MDELLVLRICWVDEVEREIEDEAMVAHLKVGTEEESSALVLFDEYGVDAGDDEKVFDIEVEHSTIILENWLSFLLMKLINLVEEERRLGLLVKHVGQRKVRKPVTKASSQLNQRSACFGIVGHC